MGGERLVRSMQKIAETPRADIADVIVGTVTSISPLVVEIQRGVSLTATFLILSPFATEKKITIGAEEITLWRGLQIADNIFMLKLAKGQKYYILQRKEGV